jgi:serine/threonine-protein kinase RsbW
MSGDVAGDDGVHLLFESPFDVHALATIRRHVATCLRALSFPEDVVDDFVIAVGEVVGNAVKHGGGAGDIQLARSGRRVRCVIADRGPGLPGGRYAPAHVRPDAENGRGLLLVFAVCAVVELYSTSQGTRVHLMIALPNDG